jgi:hypothetical protein
MSKFGSSPESSICVASKPASLNSPDITDPPPFAPGEFERTCVPPEDELVVDSCFDRGAGEAVEYEKVDEPVRLDACDVGER